MLKHSVSLRTGGLVAIAICVLSSTICAQDESLRLLNQNSRLESGLGGWQASGVSAELLTRADFFQYSNDQFGVDLGQKLVRLKGNGAWGQYLTLGANSRYHILNAFAFKQASSANAAAGFACVAVTYYDANGFELDQILVEIDGPQFNRFSQKVDGLNFYDWGIDAPAGSAFAYIFSYTTPGTTVYLDNLALFELTKANTSASLATNLIVNPQFVASRVATSNAGPVNCFGYGTEFWQANIDWENGFNGAFGSPNQPEWAYQTIPVTSSKTYSFIGSGDKYGIANTKASLAIDFYDANWKATGNTVIDLAGKESFTFLGRRVQPPVGSAHASVVVYCDSIPFGATLPAGGLRTQLQLYEQETRTTAGPSLIGTRTFLQGNNSVDVTGVVTVLYSDADGIDLATLGTQDAYFVSKTNATKTYPVSRIQQTSMDNGKLVTVNYYSATGAAVTDDLGELIVRAVQVKDTKGNGNATKKFSSLKFSR